MKVLLFNGSPHEFGCTCTALKEAAGALEKEGIETEIIHVGNIERGCIGCGGCGKTGKCVFGDGDGLNDALEKAKSADGIILGSPVHFASASGMITSFADRFFMASKSLAHKPGASVVSCRRGGASAAFDQLNKYFTIRHMPVVSSQYWNMVHGSKAEDVFKDEEGMQTMRMLGKNMAWLLKCIDNGKKCGINPPEPEKKISTNYIR